VLAGAKAALERVSAREAQIAAQDGEVEGELLDYLNEVRAAVVGLIRYEQGVDAVRAALGRLFESFTLYALREAVNGPAINLSEVDVRIGRTVADGHDRYLLKPTVRPEAVERLLNGGWWPMPERVALPYTTTHSIATQM
jgi:hypothetical protein